MKQLPVFIITALVASTAVASEQRQAGAHVHGLNTLQLAMEGSTLEITYEMPIVQLNGAHSEHQSHGHNEHDDHAHDEHDEHAHSHDEHNHNETTESPSVTKRLAALESFDELFELPSQADCRLTDYHSELKAVQTDSDHDHDHDHGDSDGHQDVFLEYRFDCGTPNALDGLVLHAFDTYDDLETVAVEAVTAQGVTSQRVTKAESEISL
jgi:hypothetical protein